MRVGVFDSGIGGLTVLHTLINKYPNNEYVYYGDTLNLPYGNKTREQLLELADNDVEFLISKNVDVIIIACGTVSSNCLDYLKNKYNVLIYDIISPTIEYLNGSYYQNIGVIATNRTIDSHIFKNNINKNIYEINTPELVPIIESNEMNRLDNVIDMYLGEYRNKIDALVLGCTHYPIISDYIDKYFNNKVKLIDMSVLLLDKLKQGSVSSIDIYYSKISDILIDNTKRILGIKDINIYQK